MKPTNTVISSCRYCAFYESEGRRGGQCHQLGVPVQGNWKVCALASSPFPERWQELEDLEVWRQTAVASLHIADPLPSEVELSVMEADAKVISVSMARSDWREVG